MSSEQSASEQESSDVGSLIEERATAHDNAEDRLISDPESEKQKDNDVDKPIGVFLIVFSASSDWPEAKIALKRVFEVAGPTCLTYTLSNILYITNLSFMGGLGPLPLAGVALGSTVFNVIALSASYGLLGAMDTLGAHAFGAKAFAGVGLVLQRGLFIITCVCAVLAPLLLLSQPLLLKLGQDPDVVKLAVLYLRFLLIGLWPSLVFDALRRYMQVQGVTLPALLCSAVVAFTNWLGQVIAVKVLKGGVIGSAVATSIAQISGASTLLAYVIYRSHYGIGERTWGGWNRNALHGLIPFVSLAIPSMLLTCSEWWVWEAIVFLAGVIGPVTLDASAIYLQTANVLFMLPLGLGAGLAVVVGHDLGAGAWRRASRTAFIGLLCTWILAVALSALLFLARSPVAAFFTADPDVQSLTKKLLLLLCIGVLADANQASCGGLVRAAALQTYGAVANLGAYYGVGLPLAIALAFWAKWQAIGLWIGIVTGEIVVAVLFVVRLLRLDWKERAEHARAMLQHSHPSKIEGVLNDNEDNL